MATQLKNGLTFANVAAGASAALPHLLNIDGRAIVPDVLLVDTPGVTATANAANVTIMNNLGVAVTVVVLAEVWHTFERAFGSSATVDLSPKPVVSQLGAATLGAFGVGGASETRIVTPGNNKAAEINAAIAAMAALAAVDGRQRTVQLIEGVYTIEASLLVASYVTLAGRGRATVLQPTFGGAADDPLNAIILARGTVDVGKMNTTLAALAAKGAAAVTVTAAGTIAIDDWVLIQGRNATSNSYLDSDGNNVSLSELVQVANVVGNVLTLTAPTEIYHAAGVTARAIAPLSSVQVKDLDLDAAGGTVAVGVLTRSCVGVTVTGVSGAGFSRGLVGLDEGTMQNRIDVILSRGENNGIVFIDSAHKGVLGRVTCDPGGLRNHANGIPRGLIHLRNRPTDWIFAQSLLEHACIGLNFWGGATTLSSPTW